MTQIKHVSKKEMLRRTGTNALGYTFPDKDLILLEKGLTGAKKREVLAHEQNHLKNGEEGPFWGAVIGAATSALAARKQRKAQQAAQAAQMEQSGIAREDLSPYREFGAEQLSGLGNWLAGPSGAFSQPTLEEIQATPGYDARLGAIESSAAAKGSLFSGNALRNIGEFGASEYDRAMARRQNELAQRMSLANVGQSAAAQSAGISQGLGQNLSGLALQGGQAQAQGWQGIGSSIAGGIGAYQGQQQWNDFLNRAYPKAGQ